LINLLQTSPKFKITGENILMVVDSVLLMFIHNPFALISESGLDMA